MELYFNLTALLIPLAFLAAGMIPTAWFNKQPASIGRLAERLAWLSLAFGVLAIVATGRTSGHAATSTLLGARLDALSITMFLLVAFLGAVILRYARNYLEGDAHQGYFFKWLAFTLGAVMVLVLSPGLVQFFTAWLLSSLGLHKLLVYFPDRLGTLLSARKKFIFSRVGDVCLLAGFVGIFSLFGSQDFASIFAKMNEANFREALVDAHWIGWCIIIGAILKSAQFPFHTWLPDTMGAPTPVSALMHAGIINAGGFLVIRLSPLLVEMPAALYSLAIVGAFTAGFAIIVMLTQTSVKRALAYSTIAQMGFMFLQCGLGAFHLAVLHIVAHSLYKGHAFLSSGSAVEHLKGVHSTRETTQPLSFTLIAGIVFSASVLVIALNYLLGINPENKPGMVVFSVILILATTQLMIKRTQALQTGRFTLPAFIVGVAFAILYFALALGSGALLQPELPQFMHTTPALEWALASILGAFLMLSILLQNSAFNPFSTRWGRAFYVHALNGFYLNTIVNRVCRSFGLVPEKR